MIEVICAPEPRVEHFIFFREAIEIGFLLIVVSDEFR